MSVSPPSSAQPASHAAQSSSENPAARAAKQAQDRDAWAANLINEMRRAARTNTPGRSL
jgi:hypothetical protein